MSLEVTRIYPFLQIKQFLKQREFQVIIVYKILLVLQHGVIVKCKDLFYTITSPVTLGS